MKNIVINEQYTQNDIKPTALIARYEAMLGDDVPRLLGNGPLAPCVCPACLSSVAEDAFVRFSLAYHRCNGCGTVFVSPRPNDAAIAGFFKSAPSKVFWREQLSKASDTSRKAKIVKPRLEWVLDSAAEYVPNARHWVDVHTAQASYLEAMASSSFIFKTIVAPYCAVAGAGLVVIDGPLEQIRLQEAADLVTLFEVLDHAASPGDLLHTVNGFLKEGGLCFITAILSSGFDVLTLGARAKNIYPPDRINVFSANGLKGMVERAGFEILEFSTPGILDVDIVSAVLKDDPALPVSGFVRDLVLNATDEVRANFQEFLQANMLSSYGRILLRKT